MNKQTAKQAGIDTSKEIVTSRFKLRNIKDELELLGWRSSDTTRYMRDALKAMHITEVVKFFEGMLVEERRFYEHHVPLTDDQLDHTLMAA